MDDQILLKSKVASGEKRFCLSIIAIIFVISAIFLFICLHWANSIRQSVYFKNWSLSEIIFGNTIYRNVWLIVFMIAHWMVLLIAVALLVNYIAKIRCNLIITPSKIIGKTNFNDNVVLFLKDIVQVAISEESKSSFILTNLSAIKLYVLPIPPSAPIESPAKNISSKPL